MSLDFLPGTRNFKLVYFFPAAFMAKIKKKKSYFFAIDVNDKKKREVSNLFAFEERGQQRTSLIENEY